MEKEFVIWGIAPSKKHEELLVSSVSYIKSMADAKKYCDILEKKTRMYQYKSTSYRLF